MTEYDRELVDIVEKLNRKAGPPRDAAAETQPSGDTASLDQLLGYAVRQNASDLLLVPGAPVCFCINGALAPPLGPPLATDEIRNLVLPLLEPQQYQDLQKNRTIDFSFVRDPIGRFRANLHYQRGTLAATIRLLPSRVPSLESLHLPSTLARLLEHRPGLVLVTGPTGCGKSSTLAAMIDLINSQHCYHIVTIEDPIEYQHANRNSIIEQIEVGYDTPDFIHSLRSILRHTPHVILVGEMRDPETMATVLTAAETGHLVFSTLHTNDASQAVSRILDSFPSANQAQMRQQLSLALLAVISQQLVPSANGQLRYPALEVLIATDAVRHLIRKGEDHQLRSQITTGRAFGMITMEQSLAELVRAGRITPETALAHCFRVDELRRLVEA